jgi:apolipoprotein N-acyltransferase
LKHFRTILPDWGLIAAVAAGAALGLAPLPYCSWLGWLGLIPLWLYLAGCERPPAFRLGLLFGLVYHAIMLRWLLGMHPLTWMGIPWWPSLILVVFLWLFVSASQAWVAGVWAWLVFRSPLAGARRVVLAVALWLGLHWLWGQGETAFPWDDLAQGQVGNPLVVQVASLGGSALIAALVVAVAGLIAEGWRDRRWGLPLTAAALLVLAHGWGVWRLSSSPAPAGPPLAVGVVQGNIPQTRKWKPEGFREAYRTYLEGYERLARQGADLVLVPETAFPAVWPLPGVSERLVARIQEHRTALLLGAFRRIDDKRLSTSLLAIDPTGRTVGHYDKQHLVPLGEQIPLKPYIGWLIRKLSPLQGDLQPGAADQILQTPFGVLAGGICFDSAFGEGFRRQVAAGAQVLLTATNDAWFGPAMASEHHALDTLRAVETGRWLVRASNNGTSATIDPRGRTVVITPWNAYAEYASPVIPLDEQTPYVRLGDWLTPLTAALGFLALVSARLQPTAGRS